MTFSINISTVLNRSFYSTWSGRRDVTGYCVVNLASGIQIKWSEEEEEEEGNWLFVCIRQQEAFIMTQFISNGTSQRSIGFIFMNWSAILHLRLTSAAQADQCLFINKDILCMWSMELDVTLLSKTIINSSVKSLEIGLMCNRKEKKDT